MVDVAAGLHQAVTDERSDVLVVLDDENSHVPPPYARVRPSVRRALGREDRPLLRSGAAHELASLSARHLIDAVDRVAEAPHFDRIEFRVDAAAELRDADGVRELQIAALERELDEVGIERSR